MVRLEDVGVKQPPESITILGVCGYCHRHYSITYMTNATNAQKTTARSLALLEHEKTCKVGQ
jgi:hypothetical protein